MGKSGFSRFKNDGNHGSPALHALLRIMITQYLHDRHPCSPKWVPTAESLVQQLICVIRAAAFQGNGAKSRIDSQFGWMGVVWNASKKSRAERMGWYEYRQNTKHDQHCQRVSEAASQPGGDWFDSAIHPSRPCKITH